MDINLHYTEKGSGAPLVLLHGNGENSDYFSSQISFFSKVFRVIAVDTRGHGLSPRGAAPFTISQFADDLKAFLDSLGIRKADLLGFSDGGNIALNFTLRYPGYVGRLILNGANLNPFGVRMRYQAPIFFDWCLKSLISLFNKNTVRKRELLSLMVMEPRIRVSALSAVSVPTLVIVGDRDMIRYSHTKKISLGIPGSKLIVIEGTHFIAAENSAAFNTAVSSFLKTAPNTSESSLL